MTSLYTASVWVPQHLLAAALVVFSLWFLTEQKLSWKKIVFLSFLTANIFFYSFFCFLSFLIGLAFKTFFDWLQKKERRKEIITKKLTLGFISLFFYFPFVFQILILRKNVLSFHPVRLENLDSSLPSQFFKYYFFNLPLEWGVVFILAVWGSWRLRRNQKILPFLLAGWTIFILGQLIVSPAVNDFGMRTFLPVQIGAVLLSGVMVAKIEKLKRKNLKVLWLSLILISLIFGFAGSFWEFKNRWQKRDVLTWEESQIVEYTKNYLPHGEAVLVHPLIVRRWAELIPVLGERLVFSSGLFSSRVYFISRDEEKIGQFFKLPPKIFGAHSESLKDFVPQEVLDNLATWLRIAQSWGIKKLILREKVWVQADQEPVAFILKNLEGVTFKRVACHLVFDINELIQKLGQVKIAPTGVIKETHFKSAEEKLVFPLGIYQLSFCVKTKIRKEIQLDLKAKEHYALLIGIRGQEVIPSDLLCGTKVFVVPEAQEIVFFSHLLDDYFPEIEEAVLKYQEIKVEARP